MCSVSAFHPKDVVEFEALRGQIFFNVIGGEFHRYVSNHYPQDLFLGELVSVVGYGVCFKVFCQMSVVVYCVQVDFDSVMYFPSFCEFYFV